MSVIGKEQGINMTMKRETMEEYLARGGQVTKAKTRRITPVNKPLQKVKDMYAYDAKPVVKDKFWIIEQLGQRIGTLQHDELGYILLKGSKERFTTKQDLLRKYTIKFMTKKELTKSSVISKKVENETHGFPCKGKPHNDMMDIKRGLPLYTKTENSKSYYCAGYYVIRFEKLWSPNYCPKLITLNKYDFIGPYKTKTEQRSALKNVKDT